MSNKLKIIPIISRLVEVMAITVFIVMMGSMIVQVIFRYILNSPLVGIEEFARFMFIWMVYLGAIISMQQGLFYRVDYFAELIPKNIRVIIYFLINIVILLFLLFLFLYGGKIFYVFRTVKSIALHWPWKYIYLSLPFSVTFMFFIAMISVNRSFKDIINVWAKSTPKIKKEEV